MGKLQRDMGTASFVGTTVSECSEASSSTGQGPLTLYHNSTSKSSRCCESARENIADLTSLIHLGSGGLMIKLGRSIRA